MSSLTHFIFRDLESLNVLSRSHLNLGNFRQASKSYRRAEKLGFKLLDRDKNSENPELKKSGNLIEAFKLTIKSSRHADRKIRLTQLSGKQKSFRSKEGRIN